MVKHHELTQAVDDKLFEWFRAGKQLDGKRAPYRSFNTSFRNA